MRKTLLSMALVVLIGGPDALAQGSTVPKNSDSRCQAPVGHRQPRAGDVPNEKNVERSERSAEQGKRAARQEDQEHLPRLLGAAARHASGPSARPARVGLID